MSERMQIAVAGATGRVGRHTVETLRERGHEVVPISRASGVDVVTGEGLAAALEGVDAVIDAATGPSPEQAAGDGVLHRPRRATCRGRRRAAASSGILVVSIIGIDHFHTGYNAAKLVHERAHARRARSGPHPARRPVPRVRRAAGRVGHPGRHRLPAEMRTQLVAARASPRRSPTWPSTARRSAPPAPRSPEIAGPREERLLEAARLLARPARRRRPGRGGQRPGGSRHVAYASGAFLPGPDATLAGPTFEAWLDAQVPAHAA